MSTQKGTLLIVLTRREAKRLSSLEHIAFKIPDNICRHLQAILSRNSNAGRPSSDGVEPFEKEDESENDASEPEEERGSTLNRGILTRQPLSNGALRSENPMSSARQKSQKHDPNRATLRGVGKHVCIYFSDLS